MLGLHTVIIFGLHLPASGSTLILFIQDMVSSGALSRRLSSDGGAGSAAKRCASDRRLKGARCRDLVTYLHSAVYSTLVVE